MLPSANKRQIGLGSHCAKQWMCLLVTNMFQFLADSLDVFLVQVAVLRVQNDLLQTDIEVKSIFKDLFLESLCEMDQTFLNVNKYQ